MSSEDKDWLHDCYKCIKPSQRFHKKLNIAVKLSISACT